MQVLMSNYGISILKLDPERMNRLQNLIPGYSMRMQEVTAAMLPLKLND